MKFWDALELWKKLVGAFVATAGLIALLITFAPWATKAQVDAIAGDLQLSANDQYDGSIVRQRAYITQLKVLKRTSRTPAESKAFQQSIEGAQQKLIKMRRNQKQINDNRRRFRR